MILQSMLPDNQIKLGEAKAEAEKTRSIYHHTSPLKQSNSS